MQMLNLACGDRYHEDWVNVDFHSESNNVKKVNILIGLPFEDKTMDVVYCSHFLEHLTQEQSTFVLQESQRILKKNGILRVVVPDLENICREYLRVLDLVSADKKYAEKYDWIIVELLDQLVRVNRGGQMGKMFFQIASTKNNQLAEYILSRTGDDLLKESKPKPRKITYDKIKNKILYLYLKSIRFLIPKNLRDLIFVDTSVGEKHQWMYDKYSMEQKLLELGFLNISIKSYKESNIPDFNSYLLDMEEDGAPYKGESSLYMEAIK